MQTPLIAEYQPSKYGKYGVHFKTCRQQIHQTLSGKKPTCRTSTPPLTCIKHFRLLPSKEVTTVIWALTRNERCRMGGELIWTFLKINSFPLLEVGGHYLPTPTPHFEVASSRMSYTILETNLRLQGNYWHWFWTYTTRMHLPVHSHTSSTNQTISYSCAFGMVWLFRFYSNAYRDVLVYFKKIL